MADLTPRELENKYISKFRRKLLEFRKSHIIKSGIRIQVGEPTQVEEVSVPTVPHSTKHASLIHEVSFFGTENTLA